METVVGITLIPNLSGPDIGFGWVVIAGWNSYSASQFMTIRINVHETDRVGVLVNEDKPRLFPSGCTNDGRGNRVCVTIVDFLGFLHKQKVLNKSCDVHIKEGVMGPSRDCAIVRFAMPDFPKKHRKAARAANERVSGALSLARHWESGNTNKTKLSEKENLIIPEKLRFSLIFY
jgi:hypothetical protein